MDLLPLDLEERFSDIVDFRIERVDIQPRPVVIEECALEGHYRDAILREIEGFDDR